MWRSAITPMAIINAEDDVRALAPRVKNGTASPDEIEQLIAAQVTLRKVACPSSSARVRPLSPQKNNETAHTAIKPTNWLGGEEGLDLIHTCSVLLLSAMVVMIVYGLLGMAM